MKTRIGAEISQPRLPRILDMRQPLIPGLAPRPARPTNPAELTTPAEASSQQSVSVKLTPSAQPEPTPEITPQPSAAEPTPIAQSSSPIAAQSAPAAELPPASPPRSTPVANPAAARRRFWRPRPWVVVLQGSFKLGLLLGFTFIVLAIKNIDLAERLIGMYALVALLYRINSQRTFLVAMIFLVLVAAWSALGQTGRAQSFAVYAFYFLVIGIIGAFRERQRGSLE